MTLAEVMLALTIITFAGLGLVKLTYQMRVTAEDNLHQSTAIVMAQGYLEQLCRLPYNTTLLPGETYSLTVPAGIQDIADNPYSASDTTAPILITNSAGQIVTSTGGGSLYNSGSSLITPQNTSSETVYLDKDSTGNPTYPMTFSFTPVLKDLQQAEGGTSNTTGTSPNQLVTVSGGTAQGVEIIVYFTEYYTLAGNPRSFTSSVRTVYANVQTY
jgi:hypothetical protein